MHTAQLMPLPLTISCSGKSRLALTFLVLPFWYLLTQVVPDILQKSSKTVACVCVYQTGVPARFDFEGHVVSVDSDLPVHLGLHHHGLEPEVGSVSSML